MLKPHLSQTDIDMALSMLDRAERGCSIMISVCEYLLKPKIPQESLERLPQLWSEVEELEKKIPEGKEFLVRNIREALGEYEQGHFLASALISSRVITYVFEKIPPPKEAQMLKDQMRKEDQRAQPSAAELKVRTLIEKGIVDGGREEEQESFLKFSKEARNILSHQAHIFPDATEALMLITSAITFCKYFIRLGLSNDKNDNDVS
jgi:predicted DNA-binding transcriptional regulator